MAYKEYDISQILEDITPELKNKVITEFNSAEVLIKQDIERVQGKLTSGLPSDNR